MKSFNQLTPRDKARIIHEWFPTEREGLLAHLRAQGDSPDRAAAEVSRRITTYGHQLVSRGRLFADQLFDDGLAPFSAACTLAYAAGVKDRHYKAVCALFFKQPS